MWVEESVSTVGGFNIKEYVFTSAEANNNDTVIVTGEFIENKAPDILGKKNYFSSKNVLSRSAFN